MEHTYFYMPLTWNASGTYYDATGNRFSLKGQVTIVHEKDQWTLDGFLEVAFPQPARFTNCYSIQPGPDPLTLTWKSYNPALGTLQGALEVVGDSILSHYISQDGVYSGYETLIQYDKYTYYNVGLSMKNGKKMSSWTAILKAESC